MWNRIWDRHNSLKPELALLVTSNYSSSIASISPSILNIIKAFGIRFPDIDLCPGNGIPGGIGNGAKNKTWFTARIMRDCIAVLTVRRFVDVEWAEYGAFCASRRLWMVDGVDKEGKT